MIATYRDPRALNFHIPRFKSNARPRATYPDDDNVNFSFILLGANAIESNYDEYVYLTCHEIGHTLGLLHTFSNGRGAGSDNGDAGNCYQESVSRDRKQGFGCFGTVGIKKCSINGDGLCDTEAGYNLPFSQIDETNCTYSGSKEDNWGDKFTPPINNFMSYTFGFCANEFTTQQRTVMYSNIILYMGEGGSPFPNINGEPWYNKKNLSLSGTVNEYESEEWVSAKQLLLAENSSYTIHDKGNVIFKAGERILFKTGFHAKMGSSVHASVGPISDCADVVTESVVSNGRTSIIENHLHEKLSREVFESYKKAKEKKEYNATNELKPFNNDKIHVYPNPVEDLLRIEGLNKEQTLLSIKMINASGQLVNGLNYYVQQNNIPNLDIRTLKPGIYFLRIETSKEIYIERIIKE